jgi:ferritin-like metal-binding protein YciE
MSTTNRSTTAKKPQANIAKKPAKKIAPKKDAAKDLKELFEDGLKDLYWAEKALYTKALPKMLKNATSSKLKAAIAKHSEETKGQIVRLEKCFAALGKKPQAAKCDAMQGLIDEGKGIIEESQPGAVRDAGIIAAAQKAEHYEIASYGTLAAFAKVLGEKICLKLLLQTLNEEKKCDKTLSGIADTNLNAQAI